MKYQILTQKKKEKTEKNWEYTLIKLERSKNSELKRKEVYINRQLMNELRALEGKPQKRYKSKPKLKPIHFAMDIAQENAKLRDTDANGNGKCISCDVLCSWWQLAGGHRFSRKFQNICLDKENINAQCHTCNWTTWPKGDPIAKERCNAKYDENINKKFWKWTAERLTNKVKDFFKGNHAKYDLDVEIPRLIEENKRLWETKCFYAPKKKWENQWAKFKGEN